MARPIKQGLDYFPIDVDLFSDIKIRRIKRDCGSSAVSVLLFLLCCIYRNGYCIDLGDDLIFAVAETTGVEEEMVSDVIDKAVSVGFFDRALRESDSILTSKGIQKRFAYVVKSSKLKRDTLFARYNLIDPTPLLSHQEHEIPFEKQRFLPNESIKTIDCRGITPQNHNQASELSTAQTILSPEASEESTQSKEKKSIVKESIENQSIQNKSIENKSIETVAQTQESVHESTQGQEPVQESIRIQGETSTPCVVSSPQTLLFQRFWAVYPKKKSKGDAEKAFKAICPSSSLVERMLNAITEQKNTPEWQKNHGQYIPHPATWLRAKGWEDEVSKQSAKQESNDYSTSLSDWE